MLLQGETQAAKASRDREKWNEWLLKYTDRLKLEVDAANESKVSLESANQERVAAMNSSNPRSDAKYYTPYSVSVRTLK